VTHFGRSDSVEEMAHARSCSCHAGKMWILTQRGRDWPAKPTNLGWDSNPPYGNVKLVHFLAIRYIYILERQYMMYTNLNMETLLNYFGLTQTKEIKCWWK